MLQQQLAMLGLELRPSSLADLQIVPHGGILAEGLAYAELVRSWQDQLANSSASSQAVFHQLTCHLNEQNLLRGWDRWIALFLYRALPAPLDKELSPLASNPVDPVSISQGQLFGVSIELARNGLVGPTAIAMSWLIEDLLAKSMDPKEYAMDLTAALVDAALNGREAYSCGLTVSQHEKWNRDVDFCIGLKAIAASLSDLLTSEPKSVAQRLSELAQDLRFKEDQYSEHHVKSMLEIEMWTAEAFRRIRLGEKSQGYRQLSDLASMLPFEKPRNTDSAAWHQLTINALTHFTPGIPHLLLIEGKSLPRTGHHYLRRLLGETHPGQFSYCEYYQEPGCCKQIPCRAEAYWSYAREQGQDHIRFIKSHDFDLADPIYEAPSSVLRLIQIRQPLHLLVSWLELFHLQVNRSLLESHGISPSRIYLHHEKALLDTAWRLIDESGSCMSMDEAHEWLDAQALYITGFLAKWLPICKEFPEHVESDSLSGSYVLRYEDLGSCSPILRGLGAGLGPSQITKSVELYNPRVAPVLVRKSKRLSSFFSELSYRLIEADHLILQETSPWQKLMGYDPIDAGLVVTH